MIFVPSAPIANGQSINFTTNVWSPKTITGNPHFKSLFNKILHPYTSDRLGFRENLSFLIGLSVYCLEKNSKKWITNEKK